MALVKSTLENALLSLFQSPPNTVEACAASWADAVESYAASIIPASTQVSSAASVLETSLVSAFNTTDASSALESAFATFASTVGTGMAPAYTATPPAGLVGFAGLVGVAASTHADAAVSWSSLIDTWMRTGTATPSGGGAPVPWS